MSLKSIGLTDDLHAYLLAHSVTPDPVVADLVAETRATLPEHTTFPIAPEQAPFLTFLTRLINARHAIEVGTFTGLSALSIARGLAPGGRLVCCDISAEFTAIARRYWDRAGVADRIELRVGPASSTLPELPTEPYLDLAFIDADKVSYAAYWSELVPRMRPGGLLLADNVLRGGRVVGRPDPSDRETAAIIEFNALVRADERVESVMIPLADGLTLARRREP